MLERIVFWALDKFQWDLNQRADIFFKKKKKMRTMCYRSYVYTIFSMVHGMKTFHSYDYFSQIHRILSFMALFHNNSLWSGDTTWIPTSWSTLVQVMACQLLGCHYLSQCWLVNSIQRNIFQVNFIWYSKVLITMKPILKCQQYFSKYVQASVC